MKYKSLLRGSLASLLLASSIVASQPSNKLNGANELKHLKKSAELKTRLFKWQLEQPRNLDFCIEKMHRMRRTRREIERIVSQLESTRPNPSDKVRDSKR
jgi:phosphatidate phosphatase PAH1